MADTLAAALWLAERNLHVFELDHPELPQCIGWHGPDDPCDGERGKHPACKWSTTATTNRERITAMFAGTTRNIGISCGPSGLVVVDEDTMGEFARFCESIGQTVPATFRVRTGKGWHYYFRQPAGVELGNAEGAFRAYAINVRGRGGYVVAPGSLHANGTAYVPEDVQAAILPCPPWLVDALIGKPTGDDPFDRPDGGKDHSWWRDPDVIHHPHRHEALVAAAGYCRKVGLSRDGATPTIRDVWRRCCPGTCCRDEHGKPARTYTWQQALAKLNDVYRRYEAGATRETNSAESLTRKVRLTPAATIQPLPVRWTWEDRIPVGELGITPGRGGIGKSTFHAWTIAHITKGTLPGHYFGRPRACVIAAAEDSWARTIVPRLLAAGADMTLVYRADVITETGAELTLTLPRDIDGLEVEIAAVGAVLLSVDPLMSVIANGLDTYKDRDVRHALEPLSRLADRTGVTVLGNAHFNKGTGTEPLALVMGSAAFGNVARAALGFARDTEDDDGSCVISQVKNNLGRLDLPSLRYRIDTAWIDTAEGPAGVGRLVMLGETDRSVADILRDRTGVEERTARDQAKDFLRTALASGPMQSKDVESAAKDAGVTWRTVRRAADDLGVRRMHPDITGPWYWELPTPLVGHQGGQGGHSSEGGHLGHLVATLGDTAGICQDCHTPLDEHAGHGCLAPVIHRPPDLWSTR